MRVCVYVCARKRKRGREERERVGVLEFVGGSGRGSDASAAKPTISYVSVSRCAPLGQEEI